MDSGRLDTRDAVNAVLKFVSEATGVDDVYPSSKRGRKANGSVSDLVACMVAYLHYEGYPQNAIAEALSRDGSSKTSYVSRCVNAWRNAFPKRSIAERERALASTEETWFVDHLTKKHPDALVAYSSRKRSGFVTKPEVVALMNRTGQKTLTVECRPEVHWDFNPEPVFVFVLRGRPNKFGGSSSSGNTRARCQVQREEVSPPASSSRSHTEDQTTNGETDLNVAERLTHIEAQLELHTPMLAELVERLRLTHPTNAEVTEAVEDLIDSIND
ncbi:MAG TPA: hypothetical protein VGH82_02460 [Gaiellaceae bacterium]|jgi:hypothetical protein